MVKYKKALATSLALLLVSNSLTLPMVSYAEKSISVSGSESLKLNEELDTIEREEVIEETFEINNIKYYFKDTPTYTLTVEMYSNGKKSVSYNDKNENIVYFNENIEDNLKVSDSTNAPELTMTNKTLKNNDIEKLKQVAEDVLNNKIELEVFDDYSIKEEPVQALKSNVVAANISQSQLIVNLLTKEIGAEFTSKHLATGYYRNHTGYVYQSRIFSGTQTGAILSRVLQAGTGLGVIMSMLSLPKDKTMRLLTFGVSATGVISLLTSSTVKTYNAYVTYTKTAKVGSIYPYRSFKEYKTTVHTLTKTAESTGYVLRYENVDYADNNAIIRKGIDNYIMYN